MVGLLGPIALQSSSDISYSGNQYPIEPKFDCRPQYQCGRFNGSRRFAELDIDSWKQSIGRPIGELIIQ